MDSGDILPLTWVLQREPNNTEHSYTTHSTYLLITVASVLIPVKVTSDISGSPIGFQWGNIQGNLTSIPSVAKANNKVLETMVL